MKPQLYETSKIFTFLATTCNSMVIEMCEDIFRISQIIQALKS